MNIPAPEDFKLAILAELAQGPREQFKWNIIGREIVRGPRSPLESRMGIEFTNTHRNIASKAFDQLREEDLTSSTCSAFAQTPEDWVEITEAGREILKTGTFRMKPLAGRGKFGFQDDSTLRSKIKQAAINKCPVSLLFLDLDKFKPVNDNHNHTVGDQIIIEFLTLVDSVSLSKGEMFHRSGDEVIVLLPNFNEDEAKGIAERIRKATESHSFSVIGSGYLTTTIGVATYPDTCPDIEKLEIAADEAAMNAKRQGNRNSVNCYYSEE